MIRSAVTFLFALAAADLCAQSLTDLAKQTEAQRNGQKPIRSYTSKDLPGPARIDSTLGSFVVDDNIYYTYIQIESEILKSRSNAQLDDWLLKWENETARDPFGMITPYSQEKRLQSIFEKNRLSPRDFVFCRVALDRARNDMTESKAQRAALPKPRLDTLDWLEKHPGAQSPSSTLQTEHRFLDIWRSMRQQK
jgi:hypothetical protein